jgi:chromatin structure-remodeling complex subunit SFH1
MKANSSQEALEQQASKSTSLVPIRVEFETDTHRIRDCFVWNLHEKLIKPESFARTFCNDLDLPNVPWAEVIANQIKAQLEDHEGVASLEFRVDEDRAMAMDVEVDEVPECRVILSVSIVGFQTYASTCADSRFLAYHRLMFK